VVDVTALPRLSVSCFHRALRLLWMEGRDLRRGTPLWLPFELVHADYTLPLPTGSGSFLMSTNGLASGNHPLEAISHGLCELVERDATTLWHLRAPEAQRQTRLSLDTVDDPDCRQVLERLERAGVEVGVWETTSDVGLPSFLCTLAERSPEPLHPLSPTSGMGCHPARQVALLRALTEAAQTRGTLIAGSRDDLGEAQSYEALQDPAVLERLQRRLRHERPERRFQEVPTFEGKSFDEDVAWELERLTMAGLEQVAVVDLTKPELQIPVVRVVVPGLEAAHEVPGYVPGARARRMSREHER
jgi:ribosomal protein S12 methylthiotransferase accessory factor